MICLPPATPVEWLIDSRTGVRPNTHSGDTGRDAWHSYACKARKRTPRFADMPVAIVKYKVLCVLRAEMQQNALGSR
jgi:hypothetical protein